MLSDTIYAAVAARRTVMCGAAALALATAAIAPAQGASSGNLIIGGDGEAATCSTDWYAVNTVPGWTVQQGNPSAICYSITQLGTPSSPAKGNAFISTGPYGNSTLTQTVTVSSASSAIDGGSVTYTLSGWLGGWTTYNGQAVVTATFLNGNGSTIGTAAQIVGPTAAQRGNVSELLARSATGAVPVGTRSINVVLQFESTTPGEVDGYADNLSLTLSTPVTPATLAPPPSAVPQFDHVFVIMMENTDYSAVIGDTTNAPFINSLAAQGTLLAGYSGVYHPSDENYLAIAGGNTFVQGAIYWPNIKVTALNIGDELDSAGKSWRAYEQGMGVPCGLSKSYDSYYAPDDAPFINFTDIASNTQRCQKDLVPTTQLATDLSSAATTPAFLWIAADDYYDGEASGNGSPTSLQAQDGWLNSTVSQIFASPAWKNQRSLLILTWDESETRPPNHVAAILVGSQGLVQSGKVSSTSYNHYSTGRTIEAALGIAPLTANDGYAQPINDAFTAGGSTAQNTLGLSASSVLQGTNLVATYATNAAQLSSTNWVGIYMAGQTPGSVSSTLWQYAPNLSGSLTFATSGLAAGSYTAYYLYNNGYTVLGSPVNFAVTASGGTTQSTLQLSASSLARGTSLVATYATNAAQLSSTNWVGIYMAGQTPGSVSSTLWQYAPNLSGSLTFATSGLAAGSYAAYYLYNNGYTVLGSPVTFTVTP